MSFIAREIGIFLKAARQPAIWENWSKAKAKYADAREAGLQLLVAQLVPDYAVTVHPQLPHENLGAFKDYCSKASAVEIDSLYEILTEPASFWLNHKADNSISPYVLELFKLTDEIFEERERRTSKPEIFRFVAGGLRFYDRLSGELASAEQKREALRTFVRQNITLVQKRENNGFAQELIWLIPQLDYAVKIEEVKLQPAGIFYNNILELPPPDFRTRLEIWVTIDDKEKKLQGTQHQDFIEVNFGVVSFNDRDNVAARIKFIDCAEQQAAGFLILGKETVDLILKTENESGVVNIPFRFANGWQDLRIRFVYHVTRIALRNNADIEVKVTNFAQMSEPVKIEIPMFVNGFSSGLLQTLKVSLHGEALNLQNYTWQGNILCLMCKITISSSVKMLLAKRRQCFSLIRGVDVIDVASSPIQHRLLISMPDTGIKYQILVHVDLQLPMVHLNYRRDDTYSFSAPGGQAGRLEVRFDGLLVHDIITHEFEIRAPKGLAKPVHLQVNFDGEVLIDKQNCFSQAIADSSLEGADRRVQIAWVFFGLLVVFVFFRDCGCALLCGRG